MPLLSWKAWTLRPLNKPLPIEACPAGTIDMICLGITTPAIIPKHAIQSQPSKHMQAMTFPVQ